MGKVLHILMNERGLDTHPSVYNALYCWVRAGWSNYIITGGATDEFSDLIEKEYRFRGGFLRRAAQLAFLAGHFDIVIVYEPRDLELLYVTRWLFPRNSYGHLVHHCLEIPTSSFALRPILKNGIHRLLFRGYRLIDTLIVQDTTRAELFFDAFPHLKDTRCFLVTNSFINAIEPAATSLDWFDQLKAKTKVLALYTGAIGRWALSDNLFNRLLKMPEVTFVFSGWSQNGYAEELATRYQAASNIYFHIGAKNRANLNYLVANSDIGLVYYESMDENICRVGLSSGKMHKFLSFQKPVLMNRLSSVHDFIAVNGFGMSVVVEEFPKAMQELRVNYPTYCENIRSRYSVLCDYEKEYMGFVKSVTKDPTFISDNRSSQRRRNWSSVE